ncbi:hypothetical protein ONZ45_g18850 [Pleurotus djamor]|nr:hypothetical protein ONZ45_g18850 [Pleurotus djamor]
MTKLASAPSDIAPAISSFLSPLLIGTILTCPLYGIMLGQSTWYFRCYEGDSTTLRTLVVLVLLLDGIQTVGLAQGTLTMYLRKGIDLDLPTAILVDIFSVSTIVLLVHCVHGMDSGLISSLAASSLAIDIDIAYVKTSFKLHDKFSDISGAVEMVTAALSDIIIAISMAVYLSRLNREYSEFHRSRTNVLISKLITYFIGIGALTSIFVLLIMISWMTMPKNLVFFTFHSVLIYGNSLLVM